MNDSTTNRFGLYQACPCHQIALENREASALPGNFDHPITKLGAGLLGVVQSRYVAPMPAFAQATILKEIKAQSFVLMDDKANIVGTLKPSAE